MSIAILLFLIIVLFASMLSILGEILVTRKCPDPELLKKVVLGRARNRPREKMIVEKHLGRCEKCRSKVDAIVSGKELP